ncbi:Ig-like domain-containing protein, partial [Planctomycetota bacterium]
MLASKICRNIINRMKRTLAKDSAPHRTRRASTRQLLETMEPRVLLHGGGLEAYSNDHLNDYSEMDACHSAEALSPGECSSSIDFGLGDANAEMQTSDVTEMAGAQGDIVAQARSRYQGVPQEDVKGDLPILYLVVRYSDESEFLSTKSEVTEQMDVVVDKLREYSYGQVNPSYDVAQVSISMANPKYEREGSEVMRLADAEAVKQGLNPRDYATVVYQRSLYENPYGRLRGVTKNSGYVHVRSASSGTILHEIGHNMGLGHANWWEPDNPNQPAGPGESDEYGNGWDAMGGRGDFNAVEKIQLGWLEEGTEYITNASPGTYRIYAYDSHNATFSDEGVDGAYYAVSFLKNELTGTGMKFQQDDHHYVLSYRNQPEYADGAYNPWYQQGIQLNLAPWTFNGDSTPSSMINFKNQLIDAHPNSNDRGELGSIPGSSQRVEEQSDAPVFIGETYVDTDSRNVDGDIYITPLRKVDPDGIARTGDEYIDVKIVTGDQRGNRAPDASWSISDTSVRPGEAVSFDVSASDADDSQLGYFWDFGLGTDAIAREKMHLNGNQDQSFVFDEAGTYTVKVVVTDGRGGTDTLTQRITVSGAPVTNPNTSPVAVNDSAATNENSAVTINVLNNDRDADGDTLSVTSASNPSNGSTRVNNNGTITYTPDANFSGTDSFTYTISDGNGGVDTATATITVSEVVQPPSNTAPVAVNDSAATNENSAIT